MKKVISLLLCLAMIMTLIVGCGSTNNAETSADTTSETNVAVSDAEATEEAAEDAVEEATETEATIEATEASQEETTEEADEATEGTLYKLPLTDEKVTLTYFCKALNLFGIYADAYSGWDEFPTVAEVEELTNVHIDFKTFSKDAEAEMLALSITAGDYSDLMCLATYSEGLESACEEDIIVDLTDYVEEYAPNYMNLVSQDKELQMGVTTNGKYYSIDPFFEEFRQNKGLLIRQDWLDEQNLEAPTTYDELTQVLKTFQSAYNTTCTITMNNTLFIDGLTGGYDINVTTNGIGYIQKDGVVEASILSDGYRDYIEMLAGWYADGLLESDFISLSNDPFSDHHQTVVGADMCGVWDGIYSTVGTWADYSQDEDFVAVPISHPVAVKGEKEHVSSTSRLDESIGLSITTACENVEVALSWLDFWYSEKGSVIYAYGTEGKSFEYNENGEPEYTAFILENEYGEAYSNILRGECLYGNFNSYLKLNLRDEPYLSEASLECWDVWTNSLDGAYTYPAGAKLTYEEDSVVGSITADISTVMSETLIRFVTGEKSMDEWDDFIDGIEAMGLQTCVDAKQAALDRYYGA